MNFQAILLVAVILGAVACFLILPALYGANARRRRRKHVAYDERRHGVDLFKSQGDPPNREG